MLPNFLLVIEGAYISDVGMIGEGPEFVECLPSNLTSSSQKPLDADDTIIFRMR